MDQDGPERWNQYRKPMRERYAFERDEEKSNRSYGAFSSSPEDYYIRKSSLDSSDKREQNENYSTPVSMRGKMPKRADTDVSKATQHAEYRDEHFQRRHMHCEDDADPPNLIGPSLHRSQFSSASAQSQRPSTVQRNISHNTQLTAASFVFHGRGRGRGPDRGHSRGRGSGGGSSGGCGGGEGSGGRGGGRYSDIRQHQSVHSQSTGKGDERFSKQKNRSSAMRSHDMRVNKHFYLSDPKKLYEISLLEPDKIWYEHLKKLSDRDIEQMLNIHDIVFTNDNSILSLLVRIFHRISTCNNSSDINRFYQYSLFKYGAVMFWQSMSQVFCTMPQESKLSNRQYYAHFLENAHSLFEVLFDRFPVRSNVYLPIDVFYGTTRQLSSQEIRFLEIHVKAEAMLQKRDRIRTLNFESSAGGDNIEEDHDILPSPRELHMKHLPLDLKENVTVGIYPTVKDYLTVQYHLIREDFIHPLRCALHKLQVDEENEHVRVYDDVHFITVQNRGFHQLHFEASEEIDWFRSKRLTYGSLLCLSKDNFQSVIFASVADRDPEDLEEGFVSVKFEGAAAEKDALSISPDTYRMLETPGYYKAYAPVVKILKKMTMNPEDLKFSKYLIDCKTEIDPPRYMNRGNEIINLKGVLCDSTTCPNTYCNHNQIQIFAENALINEVTPEESMSSYQTVSNDYITDVLEPTPSNHAPSIESSDDESDLDLSKHASMFSSDMKLNTESLDPSQLKALKASLTQELAVIQGPPGTGKTFIGLKIVEALLLNEHLWQTGDRKCPIVVVCYTNHALDQFLEGVLKIQRYGLSDIKIRRIGGRCKSEIVEEHNLKGFYKRALRDRNLYYNSPYDLPQIKTKIEALTGFIGGEFNDQHYGSYSLFFHDKTLKDLLRLCDVKLKLTTHKRPQLVNWLGIEYALPAKRADRYYGQPSIHDVLEDDRRVSIDDYFEERIRSTEPIIAHRDLKDFMLKITEVETPSEMEFVYLLKSAESVKMEDRLKIFKFCLEKLLDTFEMTVMQCKNKADNITRERELLKLNCLEEVDVIGLTTTGAAENNTLISQIQSKIVLVEEAAEVLECQIVTCLTKHTEHLILIGDHCQLRPKTNDYTVGHHFKLEVSLFERLVNNQFPHVTLEVQHRMRPEISELVSKRIYNGRLRDGESTTRYENVRGMVHNMYFIDHKLEEKKCGDLRSPSNEHEAKFLCHLCRYLLQQGYKPEEITIITPYVGQMYLLQKTLHDKQLPNNIRVTPIDNYQGEENEIILISLVRSNKMQKAGFVKDSNRICVALSRAKQGLYCIGNFTLFQSSSKLWKDIITDVKEKNMFGDSLPLRCSVHQHVTSVTFLNDFEKVPDGGCNEPCNHRLKCGHICHYKCHPDEKKHKEPCTYPCPKRCDKGHRCEKKCYEHCGNCRVKVEKVATKCGHSQMAECYKFPEDIICQVPCEKVLLCGHNCVRKCGERCTDKCKERVTRKWMCGHSEADYCHIDKETYVKEKRCKHPCKAKLACGHICKGTCGKCYQGRFHVPCREKCTRILICGHKCKTNCAMNCPPCTVKQCSYGCAHGPCGHACKTQCKPCSHPCKSNCRHLQCTRNCGEICDRGRCDKPCTKLLKCGHSCLGMCGEPCPKICKECKDLAIEDKVELIFGTEYDEGARYIQLVDCKHIFEVTSFDQWMDQKDEEGDADKQIKWKSCLLCKTPVVKTLRYANIVKQTKADINAIKERHLSFLSKPDRDRMTSSIKAIKEKQVPLYLIMRERLKSSHYPDDVELVKNYTLTEATSKIDKSKNKLTSLMYRSPHVQYSSYTDENIQPSSEKCALLISQIGDYSEWLEKIKQKGTHMTDQMLSDVGAELNRILLLEKTYELMQKVIQNDVRLNEQDSKFVARLLSEHEFKGKTIVKLSDNVEYSSLVSELQDIPKRYPSKLSTLTAEEKTMIIRAIGAKQGSWYKCPNGHYYNIGQCGGAMEVSKCPECGAQIGGQSHTLLDGNQHAREFDDSRHAAWSEGANLANYEGLEF